MDPWLLIGRSLLRMIAIERLEAADLKPFCEQLRRRSPDEAPDVGATQAKTAQAQIEKHRRGQPKMIPGAAVVARPCSRIALPSGVSRARQHKWTLIGLKLK